jgi:hypothetical protein
MGAIKGIIGADRDFAEGVVISSQGRTSQKDARRSRRWRRISPFAATGSLEPFQVLYFHRCLQAEFSSNFNEMR